MRFPGLSKPPRVYVDAKILNVHDPKLTREAYVGYVVEGSGQHNATRIDETESDDAEVRAILFAIGELGEKLKKFTVGCDHESVVSEAKKDVVKHPSGLMELLRDTLRLHPSIGLEVLKANPAHGIVTKFVNEQKAVGEQELAPGVVGPAPEIPD